jgi:Domain of unknown function (DUF4331)
MKTKLLVLVAVAAWVYVLASGASPARADFRDGTVFADTAASGRLDLGPLYVFRSPANASNTVLTMTVSPFTGVLTPPTFVQGARYDIAIDRTGDYVEDMVLRVTFGPPSPVDGSQSVLVRCLPKPRCRRYIVARGRTGQNIPVSGGGLLRAANQDIPEFFDQAGWDSFVATGAGSFPRAPGTAHDFYGPNANALAIVLELPSVRIAPGGSVIAVWARTIAEGGRRDRGGRPFIDTGLIPKVPRNSSAPERRDAFNVAVPQNDVAGFTTDMESVLTGFYKRTSADAAFLASALLPDAVIFQIGNPGGFGTLVGPGPFIGPFAGGQVLGNGRRYADDVHDIMLNLLSNGAIPTDNVGDDNGLRITDGSVDPVSGKTRAIAFPYIGAPSSTPGGPNP